MLHLSVADRLAPLATRLAEVLAAPQEDAFAPEWIAVPSEGMRRWLSLELARHLGATSGARDGVAANVVQAFPGSLRAAVLAAGRVEAAGSTGSDGLAAGVSDPWEVDRLAWAILEVLHRSEADPLLAPLVETGSGASRYRRSRRIADLFDRYHVHRPAMIRSWHGGTDVDALGRPLADDPFLRAHRWQPHLWRAVRAHLGVPSPPEQLPGLLGRLAAGGLAVDLPERLAFFGASALPGGSGFVELVSAVAVHRHVHLLLLDPSPPTSRLVAEAVRGEPLLRRARSADPTADLVAHPLLRSWGRVARETAVLLTDARPEGFPAPGSAGPRDRTGGDGAGATLLSRLQAGLRAGEVVAGPDPGVADGSVQFHAAHGPGRQAEVARDALLHALAADPTLREEDLVVLCPALDRFAPFVEAAFGPSAEGSAPPAAGRPPALRYRIADRAAVRSNTMATALDALLELAVGRFDATEVMDLLAQPAVRERHGFTDDDLSRIDDWVGATQVRWGLDPAHRAALGVPVTITTNTWRAALDRILLGAAIGDDEPGFSLADVVPLGVEGDDVALAGRFAELVGYLEDLAVAAGSTRDLVAWVAILERAVGATLAPDPDRAWEADVLHRALADLVDHATGPEGPSAVELSFGDVRRLLRDQLGAAPGRPDFFRGGVTVTSVDPLRAVPHRVVCLLGMDQPAFGAPAVSSDDLAAAAPVVGDRDARAEVRQGLLEAVLSAEDRLIVVREGHDLRTNQQVPPAVVVAELIEAVAATVEPAGRTALLDRLEVVHPRQSFDERCFTVPDTGGSPWSFDPGSLAGAEARRQRTPVAPDFLEQPLAAADPSVIELADLRRFLDHPIRFFVEQRLQLVLPRDEDARPTRLPVALSGLDRWKVGDRLLQTLLDDGDAERWTRLEHQLGTLPPGALGAVKVDEILEVAASLVDEARARGVRSGPTEVLPVDVRLADGTRIVGSVPGRLEGQEPGSAVVGFGSAKAKHRLGAWLDVVALTAHDPDGAWRSVTIHPRKAKRNPTEVTDLVVPGLPDQRAGHARDALEVIVDLYRRGSRQPVPVFSKLSYALHLQEGKPSLWTSSGGFPDRDDPYVALTYGHLDYAELVALPAQVGDPPGTGGRVARYAGHLFGAVDRTSAPRPADPDLGGGAS